MINVKWINKDFTETTREEYWKSFIEKGIILYFNILIYDMKDFIDFLFNWWALLISLFREYENRHYVYIYLIIVYLNIYLYWLTYHASSLQGLNFQNQTLLVWEFSRI